MATFAKSVVGACVAALLAWPNIVLAADDAAYPVWWKPALEFEDLDRIDELLEQPFGPEDQLRLSIHAYNYVAGVFERYLVDEQIADNCLSLVQWSEKEYRIDSDLGAYESVAAGNVHDRMAHYCHTLLAFRDAVPARTSFVRNFVLDQSAADYLPAMARLNVGCRDLYAASKANREGVPLSAAYEYFWEATSYYPGLVYDPASYSIQIEVQSDGSIVLWRKFRFEEILYEYVFEIYGRGDFNGDGLDDLLIHLETRYLPWYALNLDWYTPDPALLILTRIKPDDVLRVVDVYWSMGSEVHISCPTQRVEFESALEFQALE